MPIEYDFALLGLRSGLFPSSPLNWRLGIPNTVLMTPLPMKRVPVGPDRAKSVGAVKDLAYVPRTVNCASMGCQRNPSFGTVELPTSLYLSPRTAAIRSRTCTPGKFHFALVIGARASANTASTRRAAENGSDDVPPVHSWQLKLADMQVLVPGAVLRPCGSVWPARVSRRVLPPRATPSLPAGSSNTLPTTLASTDVSRLAA